MYFQGAIPLVVHVENADIIASLIKLKIEYEHKTRRNLRMTLAGAAEAHLLAGKISKQNISVILTPSRPFPFSWDQQRM